MKTPYKVYNGKDLIASTAWASDAAVLLVNYSDGRIKYDGRIVYTFAKDGCPSESFDHAATIINSRVRKNNWNSAVRHWGEERARKIYSDAGVRIPS